MKSNVLMVVEINMALFSVVTHFIPWKCTDVSEDPTVFSTSVTSQKTTFFVFQFVVKFHVASKNVVS